MKKSDKDLVPPPEPTRQKIVAIRKDGKDSKSKYEMSAYDEMRSRLAC